MDWLPTFVDLCGLKPSPGPIDGIDIAPLLRGGEIAARPLYWHFPHYANQGSRPSGAAPGRMEARRTVRRLRAELYNLKDDPGEYHNLAASHPDLVRDLRRQLDEWRTSVDAERNRPNPHFDAALHKKLYEDVDVSQLRPAATSAAMRPPLESWRRLMEKSFASSRNQNRESGFKPGPTFSIGVTLIIKIGSCSFRFSRRLLTRSWPPSHTNPTHPKFPNTGSSSRSRARRVDGTRPAAFHSRDS